MISVEKSLTNGPSLIMQREDIIGVFFFIFACLVLFFICCNCVCVCAQMFAGVTHDIPGLVGNTAGATVPSPSGALLSSSAPTSHTVMQVYAHWQTPLHVVY